MKGRRRLIFGNISKVKCILTHRAKQATQDHTNPSPCKAKQGEAQSNISITLSFLIICSIFLPFGTFLFYDYLRAFLFCLEQFVLFETVLFYLKQFCSIWNSFVRFGTVLFYLEEFCSFFSIWNIFVHLFICFYADFFVL